MASTINQLRRWEQLAETGDADALIVVAWEYVKGEIVTRDIDHASALFRAAERQKPAMARFNLAKAKVVLGDETFSNEIDRDCEAGFGPALYLMGAVEARGLFREKNTEKAIGFFLRATESHHLVSEFFVWRLKRKSLFEWISTLPRAIFVMLKTFVIKVRRPDDLRVLT